MSDAALVFAINGELSIYRAAELAQALQTWWPQAVAAGAVQLDLGEVSEMDSAGLQLLLSTQRTSQAQHLPFQLLAASPAVVQVLQLTGLEHLLPATTASYPSTLHHES